ncbi:MAG: hypothetical protein KDK39_12790 [Leptospiraceae bacterium]|nr:hypothetical protein [Leptospiraceae bacterium]
MQTRLMTSFHRRGTRPLLLCALLIALVWQCVPQDTRVSLDEAYSEIAVAIGERAKRCGQEPAYPLIILQEPTEYGLRLCSLLILEGDCPFHDYPIGCVEMYTDTCDGCDLPLFDP